MSEDGVIDIPLHVTFHGPCTAGGRISLDYLAEFSKPFQSAVEQVASVLLDEPADLSPKGVWEYRRQIRDSCALDVVAFKANCFDLAVGFHNLNRGFQEMDQGRQALTGLIEKMNAIVSGAETSAVGHDLKTLKHLHEMGRMVERGDVERIEFQLKFSESGPAIDSVYDAALHARVKKRLDESKLLIPCTVEGQLLMGDFADKKWSCRIHTDAGAKVTCEYDPELLDQVQRYMRRRVRVTGEAENYPHSNRIKRLTIATIELLAADANANNSDAAGGLTLDELIAQTDISPAEQLDGIFGAGKDWWEDDDFESFVNGIYARRRQGLSRERNEDEQ